MGDLSAAVWRKSSRSGDNGCVEVAVHQDGVAVRDSKDTAGAVLLFSATEWERFLHVVRPGRAERGRWGSSAVDRSGTAWRTRPRDDVDGRVQVAVLDGAVTLRRSGDRNGPVLVFTHREWEAFLGGVGNGEFDLARLASLAGRR